MLHLLNAHSALRDRTLIHVPELTLNAGEFLGIIGPNGAGKSSLLNMISGDRLHQGNIELHGTALSHWPPLARARHVGVLPQASTLTFPFSAEEVVALGLTPLSLSRRESHTQIAHFMRQTGCDHLAQQAYPALSGGERQRVQLARVLLQVSQAEQAPLLILDEPTSAQDLGQQHQVLQLARTLADQQGYGVIAVLHELNQVLRYCHRCALVAHGALVAQGTPDQVLTADTIAEHWAYRPRILNDGTTAVIL